MRLLHVYSGNLYGGIEAILVSLARHCDRSSELAHEFALCFDGRLSDELEAVGARVHRIGEIRLSRPYSIRRARRALNAVVASGRFDRIVFHAPWSYGLLGAVARHAGVPFTLWIHDATSGRHWTERLARRMQPDLVICNSQYTARMMPPLYPKTPIAVLYAPIDVSTAPLSPAERRSIRKELKTPDDALVVVQASRMQAWKGHHVVMEALARLRGNTSWVWWIVGGSQRPEETAYLKTLVASADRLGIADRVRWPGERSDVRRLLAAADVYCQANVAPEPFGIAYIEALAAGLPVVASRAGGTTEIIDESCGLLVTSGDPAELSAALDRLLVDNSLREKLAGRAPARARLLCDPPTQMIRLEQMLAQITPARVEA
jgi:glycosyltransferase involved in cell wall biosynthesis